MDTPDHQSIIPSYQGADLLPAWPAPVAPWPPRGTRIVLAMPDDPWSEAHLEPVDPADYQAAADFIDQLEAQRLI